ncbi:DUF421 domain-containing protein [Nonomuraea sp. LPB2021202275-12-8]|uniref:DUF421 domain-containing protein n=1 Tax=Nonomuraea sp. LPB2021202275-12-8 TaxID=3120159 RepID=UPI00300CA499
MWHDMLAVQIPIVEKVLRTILVYALIVVLFRISGKRGLANLNTFDFAVIFLLSNVVQNAVIGPDNSVTGGVIGAVTLVVVNAALNRWLALDERAGRVIEGTPTTVIQNGRLVKGAVRRLALRRGELENAIRTQQGDRISDVASARLEPDGRLVVVLKREESNATRADISRLEERLAAIESLLRRDGTRS